MLFSLFIVVVVVLLTFDIDSMHLVTFLLSHVNFFQVKIDLC